MPGGCSSQGSSHEQKEALIPRALIPRALIPQRVNSETQNPNGWLNVPGQGRAPVLVGSQQTHFTQLPDGLSWRPPDSRALVHLPPWKKGSSPPYRGLDEGAVGWGGQLLRPS